MRLARLFLVLVALVGVATRAQAFGQGELPKDEASALLLEWRAWLEAGELSPADLQPDLNWLIEVLERKVFVEGNRMNSQADSFVPMLADAWILRAESTEKVAGLSDHLEQAAKGYSHELCARLASAVHSQLRLKGDWRTGMQVLQVADRTCTASTAGGRFRVQVELSMEWRNMGDFAMAQAALDRAGTSLASLAWAAPLEEAEQLRREAFFECELLGRQVELLLSLGLGDRVQPLLRRELELAPRTGSPLFEAAAKVHQCDLLINLQRSTKAYDLATRAIDVTHGRVRMDLRLRQAIAAWESARKDPNRWTPVARSLLENLFEEDSTTFHLRLAAGLRLVDLEWATGEQASATKRLSGLRLEMRRVDRIPIETDLYLAELRARMALESEVSKEERAAAHADLQMGIERLLTAWAGTPERPGGLSILQYAVRRRLIGTAVRFALAESSGEEGVREALELLHRVQGLGSLLRSGTDEVFDLDEVLAELRGPNRGALLYMPGRGRTHLFLIDEGPLTHLELGSPDQIETVRRELSALAQHAAFEEWEAQRARVDEFAAVLGQELLPDSIRSRISKWSRMTVIGEGLLGSFPFELLPFGGQRVGEVFAIDHVPSLPLVAWLDSRSHRDSEGPKGLQLVIAPEMTPAQRRSWKGLRSIPFGDSERAALTTGFESEGFEVFHGAQANRQCFRMASRRRVLHIVTHGVQDYSREQSAALILTPTDSHDGILTCTEVESMDVPPLVFLSVCGAGSGLLRRGDDGTQHLGRAFLFAGARGVILSSYDLDYRVALSISEAFFDRLMNEGDTPAEALRRARVELRDAELFPPAAGALIQLLGVVH